MANNLQRMSSQKISEDTDKWGPIQKMLTWVIMEKHEQM